MLHRAFNYALLFLSIAAVLASEEGRKHLIHFIQIQSERFGVDAEICLSALAVCQLNGKKSTGLSTGAQIGIAVAVIVVLVVLLQFVKLFFKVILGHAVALGVLYTSARYVPFMRRYFIQVLSRKAA
jgi:hypothetical protein